MSKATRRSSMQSMTGYGRASKRTAMGSVTVELRSTNHRYLEIEQRLPSGMAALQGRLAELIRGQIRRGRVEALVVVQATNGDQRRVTFDEPLLERYHRALLELKARFGLKGPLTLEHLLSLPQAMTISEDRASSEQLWDAIREVMRVATRELMRSRVREGAKLVTDLRQQMKTMEQHLRAIVAQLPKAQEQQRQRLRQRLQELLGPKASRATSQLEEALSLVRDADIHEERIRLESHITHMRRALTHREPVGKQLDFIAQELMREANTMGAKVNDALASQHVFAIKGSIEKIREQVQNLE